MTDLFLKFPDSTTAMAVLYTDEQLRFQDTIDQIGIIYKPTGTVITIDNIEYPETAPLPGWHVNLRGVFTEQQLAELNAFVIIPSAPVRVWV